MNILILTSVYPQEDDEENIGVTPVVEYFAKEWSLAGHNVLVVHNSSKYPKILYLLPNSLLKKINSKFGIVIPNLNQQKVLQSEREGVTCFRLPMLKLIPKNVYLDLQVKRQFKNIISILNQKEFTPDLVIGHWENPQIPLLSMFKRRFDVKTSLVFHGLVYIKQKRYNGWAKKYLKDIDVIGCRSVAISNKVKELLTLKKEPYICYSGIPDKFYNKLMDNKNIFDNKVPNSYLYVGRIIKRKNVNVSISILNELHSDGDFIFNIVGEGAEKEYLLSLRSKFKLTSQIKFLGYKQREDVMEIMRRTEVFIMISDHETFGLVYIEAMSKGCIVIASRNGGMDGIIIHGHNGYLCEQGNGAELLEICKEISEMSLEEKAIMSYNAIKTASNFRDSKAAQSYLDTVMNS